MASEPAETYDFRQIIPAVFLIIYAVSALIYSNSLLAPFYFDDMQTIVENPHIRLTRLTCSHLMETHKGYPVSRALSLLTFALNYYFSRYQENAYRLVNIFIHVFNGCLVFLLAWQTLRMNRQKPFLISLVAGLLWLTLPLHTQSVTYIVQRMNSLSAMFYLLAMACYIRARQGQKRNKVNAPWFAGSVLAGLCGLISKETAATLPLFIFLYEWFFFQDLDRTWLKKHLRLMSLIILLTLLIILVNIGGHPLGWLLDTYRGQPFSPGQRLLTEPRVLIYYISLLFFPHPKRLALEYDFPLSVKLTEPAVTLPAMAALIALIILAVFAAKKDRLLSFSILWFLGNLVIESSVIGLALIFEHRTYLPAVFPALAAAALLTAHVRPRPLAIIVIGALIGCYGFWTYQRNITWQDRLSFWQDGCAKSPGLIRPRNDYGLALAQSGQPEKAIIEYEKAASLPGGEKASVYNNLGTLYYQTKNIDKAIFFLLKAIQAKPDFAKAYMNMGIIKAEKKDYPEAIRLLKTAVTLDPDDSAAQNALGKAYYESGRTKAAIRHCRLACDLDPLNSNAENNLGAILLGVGQVEKALPHLEKAINISPENPQTNINIGIAYKRLDNPAKALFHLYRAVFLAPDLASAHAELGLFMLGEGKAQDARVHLEKALALQPDLVKARLGLAAVLEQQGLADEAITQYNNIIVKDPNNAAARDRLKALLEKKKIINNE
jgi:tetratricopeptide (TPR) repeat protein